MAARGVKFVRDPRVEPYGTVAVFEDLYGNRWDLLQLKAARRKRKYVAAGLKKDPGIERTGLRG